MFEGGWVTLREEKLAVRNRNGFEGSPFSSRERVWKMGGEDDQRRNELSFVPQAFVVSVHLGIHIIQCVLFEMGTLLMSRSWAL